MDPLSQLQSVIEKNSLLNLKFDFPMGVSANPLLFSDVLSSSGGSLLKRNISSNGNNDVPNGAMMTSSSLSVPTSLPSPYTDDDITGEIYRCHICTYSCSSKNQFEEHINSHFAFKCSLCDYTSRTEGRLKRHVRDFHSEKPPPSWAGNRDNSGGNTRISTNGTEDEHSDNGDHISDGGSLQDGLNNSSMSGGAGGGPGKPRKYTCKQCDFVAICKNDFWEHNKTHIKSEKLLTCPKCPFVTEYKHHLEYHLRNHFGSKPFKCAKCNYSCVNKSMLNSHMKSHSNVYQYRCKDCSYATKYCHSLKLHLRKYSHQPATVLNLDGTPNPYPIIDVYGTRRGPRPKNKNGSQNKKDHQQNDHESLSPTGGMSKNGLNGGGLVEQATMERKLLVRPATQEGGRGDGLTPVSGHNLHHGGVSTAISNQASHHHRGTMSPMNFMSGPPIPPLMSAAMGYPFLPYPGLFANGLLNGPLAGIHGMSNMGSSAAPNNSAASGLSLPLSLADLPRLANMPPIVSAPPIVAKSASAPTDLSRTPTPSKQHQQQQQQQQQQNYQQLLQQHQAMQSMVESMDEASRVGGRRSRSPSTIAATLATGEREVPSGQRGDNSGSGSKSKLGSNGNSGSNGNVVPLKCSFCDFTAVVRELYGKHLLQHMTEENHPNHVTESSEILARMSLSPQEVAQKQRQQQRQQQQQQHAQGGAGNGSNRSQSPASSSALPAEMEEQKAHFNELLARHCSSPNSRKLLETIISIATNVLFTGCCPDSATTAAIAKFLPNLDTMTALGSAPAQSGLFHSHHHHTANNAPAPQYQSDYGSEHRTLMHHHHSAAPVESPLSAMSLSSGSDLKEHLLSGNSGSSPARPMSQGGDGNGGPSPSPRPSSPLDLSVSNKRSFSTGSPLGSYEDVLATALRGKLQNQSKQAEKKEQSPVVLQTSGSRRKGKAVKLARFNSDGNEEEEEYEEPSMAWFGRM